jgi:hypothetical protein
MVDDGSARIVAEADSSPATIRRGHRGGRAARTCWALGAALLLLVFLLVAHFKHGSNQVVGSPTRAQVTGTWGGDYGSALVLLPDGTFTSAGLPPHVGTSAPEISSAGTSVLGVWPAHGTWTIGPGDRAGSPQRVIFTVDCGATPSRCAGHPATFELLLETSSPDGGDGPALFYYLGSTHNLASQYPFVRVT